MAMQFRGDDKKKPKMIQVTATGGGRSWPISVAEGSRMHSMSKELGTVPEEFRNLKGVTQENDPFAANLKPKEQESRMNYWDQQTRNN